MDHTSKKMEL